MSKVQKIIIGILVFLLSVIVALVIVLPVDEGLVEDTVSEEATAPPETLYVVAGVWPWLDGAAERIGVQPIEYLNDNDGIVYYYDLRAVVQSMSQALGE